jgi:hypothetical protein
VGVFAGVNVYGIALRLVRLAIVREGIDIDDRFDEADDEDLDLDVVVWIDELDGFAVEVGRREALEVLDLVELADPTQRPSKIPFTVPFCFELQRVELETHWIVELENNGCAHRQDVSATVRRHPMAVAAVVAQIFAQAGKLVMFAAATKPSSPKLRQRYTTMESQTLNEAKGE